MSKSYVKASCQSLMPPGIRLHSDSRESASQLTRRCVRRLELGLPLANGAALADDPALALHRSHVSSPASTVQTSPSARTVPAADGPQWLRPGTCLVVSAHRPLCMAITQRPAIQFWCRLDDPAQHDTTRPG